ncbi:MAG TPA: class I SAM-dependent methyltransferase [Tepidisphaeraceae bacterium]|nr:class I SAM-dependent methyltransferase [Tepidisphaeraceae bacterium]
MHVCTTTLPLASSYQALSADRSSFQRAFVELVCGNRESLGTLLDIGCGSAVPPYLARIAEMASVYDGVDPSPDVQSHAGLRRRWRGTLESSDIPQHHYDTALAYNVLEHVPTGGPFFEKVAQVLKPGGTFWALTPHARHPFAWLSNAVRLANLKRLYRARYGEGVNAYASYYRLNSVKSVVRQVNPAGFSEAHFYYLPCAQWDRYIPAPLRPLGQTYDRLLGRWHGPSMLLLAMKLTTACQRQSE